MQRPGRGTYMAKTDILSAFRLFPVHPQDWELLGMKWEGKYYFDKVLPFGLRRAPSIFNQLSNAIEWILAYELAILYTDNCLLHRRSLVEPGSSERRERAPTRKRIANGCHHIHAACKNNANRVQSE